MREIIFKCEDLGFSYDHKAPILKKLNLTIHSGEAVSILGANGCGKSTLLKMFSGLIFPDSGKLIAFGEELTAQSMRNDNFAQQYHRRIGFIFQDSDVQLFCNSVEEELAFGLLQLGFSADETRSRINDIIKLLGIEHLIDITPFKLSGGEKKKVAIAATLLMNPEVLILDEPTNALDPKTQQWLVQLLNHLHQAGKTLIVTTHNLDLVGRLTTRGILFNEQHQIVADDELSNIMTNHGLLRQVNLIY